jgi:PhnB protein
MTKPIPDGYTTITPYLVVRGAEKALALYKKAFGALEVRRMAANGVIFHADVKIGNAHFMIADEFPEQGFKSPQTLGGCSSYIHLYVENADEVFQQAINAGMKEIKKVETQFFGDRHGLVEDQFGYFWTIATHLKDVSQEEIDKKLAEYAQQT